MASAALWTSPIASCYQWKVSMSRNPSLRGSSSSSYCCSSGRSLLLQSQFGLISPSTTRMRVLDVIVPRATAAEGSAKAPKPKTPSAVKRAKKAEAKRMYHKSRKSEIKTRMKKVFLELEALKKKGTEANEEEIKPVEKLIAEAFSIIDKSVKVHTLHKNTGARRKSRLARAKRSALIDLGWYTPVPAAA